MFTKEFELKQGDEIIITLERVEYRGKVLSASFYGPREGWFIEIRRDSGSYHYWKQGSDGGTIWKN